jgi:hypothetical protein
MSSEAELASLLCSHAHNICHTQDTGERTAAEAWLREAKVQPWAWELALSVLGDDSPRGANPQLDALSDDDGARFVVATLLDVARVVALPADARAGVVVRLLRVVWATPGPVQRPMASPFRRRVCMVVAGVMATSPGDLPLVDLLRSDEFWAVGPAAMASIMGQMMECSTKHARTGGGGGGGGGGGAIGGGIGGGGGGGDAGGGGGGATAALREVLPLVVEFLAFVLSNDGAACPSWVPNSVDIAGEWVGGAPTEDPTSVLGGALGSGDPGDPGDPGGEGGEGGTLRWARVEALRATTRVCESPLSGGEVLEHLVGMPLLQVIDAVEPSMYGQGGDTDEGREPTESARLATEALAAVLERGEKADGSRLLPSRAPPLSLPVALGEAVVGILCSDDLRGRKLGAADELEDDDFYHRVGLLLSLCIAAFPSIVCGALQDGGVGELALRCSAHRAENVNGNLMKVRRVYGCGNGVRSCCCAAVLRCCCAVVRGCCCAAVWMWILVKVWVWWVVVAYARGPSETGETGETGESPQPLRYQW